MHIKINSTHSNTKAHRERVYICSPLRPKSKDPAKAAVELADNLARMRRACDFIIHAGAVPLCSSLYCIEGLGLDDSIPEHRQLGIEIGLDMLREADSCVVVGEHISEGMAAEIALASELGLPVRMICENPGFLEGFMRFDTEDKQ